LEGLNILFQPELESYLNELTFIFYESKHNNYLITNIVNSHCQEAKWL